MDIPDGNVLQIRNRTKTNKTNQNHNTLQRRKLKRAIRTQPILRGRTQVVTKGKQLTMVMVENKG